MKSRLPSLWKRLGGKANLHRWIISHLPRHESFVEVFGGSAPVLLNKRRAKGQEIYNDLDGLWFNSWSCARNDNEQLAQLIDATPYGRQEFYDARDTLNQWRRGEVEVPPLELARLHMVVLRQSFSADGNSWSTSSFGDENRPRLWARLPAAYRRCFARLQGIHIEQRDYAYILERYDHERATFYLDPPYLNVEKRYYDVNRQGGFDHVGLRNAVESVKGSVVISYYDHPNIRELYTGWSIIERPVTVHAGDEKRQETELLIVRSSGFGRPSRKRRGYDLFAHETA